MYAYEVLKLLMAKGELAQFIFGRASFAPFSPFALGSFPFGPIDCGPGPLGPGAAPAPLPFSFRTLVKFKLFCMLYS